MFFHARRPSGWLLPGRGMKRLLPLGAHVVSVLGLLLMATLTSNKYEWMSEMDPSIPANAIDTSGNSTLAAGLLLAFVIVTQLILAIKSRKISTRLWSGTLILLAIAVWAWKFRA